MVQIKLQIFYLLITVSLTKCFNSTNYNSFRLPNNTVPLHYDINIFTNFSCEQLAFKGSVSIKIKTITNENFISLHSALSNITNIQLKNIISNTTMDIVDTFHNLKTDILTIILAKNLIPGFLYRLTIDYMSNLRTDKLGFYLSSYIKDNGYKSCLAATQFAPTQARYAFPCYDEPSKKATFMVSIKHPENLFALSNRKAIKVVKSQDGFITTKFQETPLMSTYLVGIVISDFDKLILKSNKPNQIDNYFYFPQGVSNKMKFASIFGQNVLNQLTSYFNVKQPLEMMQNVALPDFHFSGMENWGLTTFKMKKLLFNNSLQSINNQLEIIDLIAHEMSHQWFGNLVTMKWWTHVWLKEGFSRLFQFYGADMVSQEWHSMDRFLNYVLHSVMILDSDKNIRPMSHYIEVQSDIMANYDKIAYDKSACVLRMMQHAFSFDVFKKGIDIYLNKMKYNSATEDDFFYALQSAMNSSKRIINIFPIMKSWTNQPGYPMVTIVKNAKKSSIILTQRRFMHSSETNNISSLWWIPINFADYQSWDFINTTAQIWLKNSTMEIKIDKNYTGPIIANKQQTGYYRVNYDQENWASISSVLLQNHLKIHRYNRAQLIDDAFTFSFMGYGKISTVLSLVQYLKKEYEFSAWAAFTKGFKELKRRFSQHSLFSRLQINFQQLVNPIYDKIGVFDIPRESILQKLLRQIIVKLLCDINGTKCLNEIRLYNQPNMRKVFFCNQIMSNNISVWNYLFKLLANIGNKDLRDEAILGLSCAKNITSIANLFSFIVNNKNTELTTDEKLKLFQNIYRNGDISMKMTIKFFEDNTEIVSQVFKENVLENIFKDIALYTHSHEKFEKILKIMKKLKLQHTVQKEVTSLINKNINWIKDNEDDIKKWIEKINKN